MELNQYQKIARTTAIYPEEYKVVYPVLGLNGEAGEVAEKVKKVLRDNYGKIDDERKKQLSKELGDVLWYLANTATDLGLSLDEIALENLQKLQSRKERGVLQGNGDNR